MYTDLTPDALAALRAYLRAVIFAEPLQLSLLAHYGIRLSDLQALRRLADLGSVPISQFAEAVGISRSTATGLVDRLEARGLLTRIAGPTDRRTIHVATTPLARIALEDRALWQQSALAQRIAALPPEEQQHLAALLGKVTDVAPVDDTDTGSTQLIENTPHHHRGG